MSALSLKEVEKNNTWNIRLLVDNSFVPSSKQPSVIYCRLTDFKIYQKYNNIQVIPNAKKIAELVLFNLQCFFNIIVTYKSTEYKFTGHDEIIRSCNIFQQFHSSKPCKRNDTSSGGKFKCDPKNRNK